MVVVVVAEEMAAAGKPVAEDEQQWECGLPSALGCLDDTSAKIVKQGGVLGRLAESIYAVAL